MSISSLLVILLLIFWFTVVVKRVLFWTYLWQLKEYHLKRFIDHFRTRQGKRIFLNVLFLLKIAILVLLISLSRWSLLIYYFIVALYLAEFLKAGIEIFKKRILKPVITAKAAIIIALSLIIVIGIVVLTPFNMTLSRALTALLVIDIFSFIIVTFFVAIFWPITKIFQKRLLNKAKKIIASKKDLIVIAIAGSYGKTTTKEILYAILSKKFRTLKTREHINAEVGIAKTIIDQLNNQEIFIVEAGAYERGKIRQVCEMVKPKMGILTGINQQHLATFGSQENIIKGKFELIESLPEDGIAFLNIDNEFIRKKINEDMFNVKRIILVGNDHKEFANIWAENIISGKDRFRFTLKTKDGSSIDFLINMPGAYNAINVMLAIALSHHLGIDYGEMSKTLLETQFLQKAMEVKKGKNDWEVIDSSYSANPDGVMSALDYLTLWHNKRILVMPSLIELGSSSKDIHFLIGQKIAEICDLAIIVKDDQFKAIQDGAVAAGMDIDRIVSISNYKDVFKKISEFASSGDVILLEGRIPESFKRLLLE
jgi:UDP-N-acetylmuramoyl-tripeptide--D-alanyl-D-alanine ligase